MAFKDLIKSVKHENMSIFEEEMGSAEFSGYIDTGCYILNALLSGSIYGGVPNNKITCFAGEQATGKTFFTLSIIKNFLQSNPEAAVIYFDTEGATTKKMMKERGIDTNRVALGEPVSIQDFRTTSIEILDKYVENKETYPLLMVLDSLGNLSTSKEIQDTTDGKDTADMTRARLLKATFRVLTLKLSKAKVPLIVTNHTYASVGAYIPTQVISGGSGLLYAASTIITLSKKKDKDGTDVVGNIIKAKTYKSRFSKENAVAEMRLSYTTGIDKYYGLLDLAEKHGIIKKVSTRYELPDGTKLFGKAINENPEKIFNKEMLEKLEEAAKIEFSYGNNQNNIEEQGDIIDE